MKDDATGAREAPAGEAPSPLAGPGGGGAERPAPTWQALLP